MDVFECKIDFHGNVDVCAVLGNYRQRDCGNVVLCIGYWDGELPSEGVWRKLLSGKCTWSCITPGVFS